MLIFVYALLQVSGLVILLAYGIRRITSIVIFYAFNTSYFAIGSMYYVSIKGLAVEQALAYMLFVNSVFPIVGLGALLMKMLPKSDLDRTLYTVLIWVPPHLERVYSQICVMVGLFSLAIGLTYFSHGIPIFSSNPEAARFEAIRGNLLQFLFLTYIAPGLLSTGLLGMSGRNALIVSILMVFVTYLTAFRSPLIRTIFFWGAYMSGRKPLRLAVIAMTLVAMSALLVMLTYLKFPNQPLQFAVERTMARLFMFSTHDVYFVVTAFPERFDFLRGGAWFMELMALAPGYSVSFDGWIYGQVYGSEGATNSGAGALWADFGGFYVIPLFCVGLLLGLVDNLQRNFQLSKMEVATYAFLAVPFGSLGAAVYGKFFSFALPVLLMVLGARFLLVCATAVASRPVSHFD